MVSRRLMEALRGEGVDARMLVCEKLTDSPYVELAASPKEIKRKFLTERLKIFLANGFNRSTLFKIDTGEEGLPLWRNPLIADADAVLLNWVNQGMLSLKGLEKILRLGRPVIWTMHDMWCMTGICHHAGQCNHFKGECGNCPLLGKKSRGKDLSHKVWWRKFKIFTQKPLMQKMAFVAVSSWLKGKGEDSRLLKGCRLEVIPNAFKIPNILSDREPILERESSQGMEKGNRRRILFGAARLDDPIKGLDTLKETSKILKEKYPEIADGLEIAMFGNIKNPSLLDEFPLPLVRLGVLKGEEAVRKAYTDSDIVVSASSYETLPGTLVEAQAYGCVPIGFRRGGQEDIIDHRITGYLASYDEDINQRARNLAEGIIWAIEEIKTKEERERMAKRMRENVEARFSYPKIARQYISLIETLRDEP